MRDIGKKLRASHIALDIALYGEIAENQPIVDALYQEACGGDFSLGTMLVVPPGTELSDRVTASPIVLGEAAGIMPGGGGGAAAAAAGADFGDEDDPNLLIAIQESLREDAERKERERKQAEAAAAASSQAAPQATTTPAAPAAPAAQTTAAPSAIGEREALDLQRALVMTMLPPAGVAATATATTPATQKAAEPPAAPGAKKAVSRIQPAQNPPPATPTTSTTAQQQPTAAQQQQMASTVNALFADQDFLRELLEDVDSSSAQYLASQISAQAQADKDKEQKDGKDGKDDKDDKDGKDGK